MENLQLNEVCRLCLTKHKDMQLAIEVGAIDRLLDCACIHLPSDSLICNFCKNEVNKWYSFKQQVLKSLEVAEFIEKHKKETSVLENNYIVIEECFVKTEIDNQFEEVEVKPDISQINALMFQEQPESLDSEETPPTTQPSYKCGTCNRVLRTSAGLFNHEKKFHSNKPKPRVSPAKTTEETVPEAVKEQHEDNKYQCDLCHKSFNSKMGIMWHKQLHSALKLDSSKGTALFTCPFCPMSYEKKLSLIDHIKWKHPRLVKRVNQIGICDHCGKFCESKSELRAHLKTHQPEKLFTCEVCNRNFVTSNSLVVHNRVHKGGKAFSCAHCGRSFWGRSQLLSHQATHQRSNKCHVCNRIFKKNFNLKNHMKKHHSRSNTL